MSTKARNSIAYVALFAASAVGGYWWALPLFQR
jgi:hypothetical protein